LLTVSASAGAGVSAFKELAQKEIRQQPRKKARLRIGHVIDEVEEEVLVREFPNESSLHRALLEKRPVFKCIQPL